MKNPKTDSKQVINIPHRSTLRSGLREAGNAKPPQRSSFQRNLLALRLPSIFPKALATLTLITAPLQTTLGQAAAPPPVQTADQAPSNPPPADPAEEFRLPGLVLNKEERCLDLDGTVCLRQGALELIACTKGGKVHESIIAVEAKPVHIHTALLLLASRRAIPRCANR